MTYVPSGNPANSGPGSSSVIRQEFAAIAAAIDAIGQVSLPQTPGVAIVVSASGNGLDVTVGKLALAGNFTLSGAHNITLIGSAAVSLTLPAVAGTLATLAGTETLTNKTLVAPALGAATATSINGNFFTTGTYTLTGTGGKTLTFSNSLTLAGTDGSTINIGTGGTLGTNAYTSTAYAALASPTLTGTPAAPTAAPGTNTTQIATTAYVTAAVSASGGGTVSSVDISGGTTGLTSSGGPITASGTFTLGGTLATGSGGTNLTSFTSGGAVYATSTTVLTTGTLPLASGGTAATSASGARTSLGLGSLATASTINNSNWSGTVLAVANGGTAASDAATARTNLGLGSIATQASSSVSITGGSITGITDLAVADGGTGASTAANARTNLGLGTLATASTISNADWSGTDLAVANGGTASSTAAGGLANLGGLAAAGGEMSGNLLMGTANATPGAGDTDVGSCLASNGSLHLSNDGAYVLSVNRNSDGAAVIWHRSGTDVGSVDVTTTTTTYNTSSDRSKKENFRAFDSIAMVKATRTYLHDWIGKPDAGSSYGVIADEAQVILPQAVRGKPGNQMVDYSKYAPILLDATKKMIARIEALENGHA